MQTKQQIQRLLASAGTGPNKRLGQNFLIDLNLMRLLVDAARIHSNDVILEVGPGTGSFTEGLAEVAGKVVCVEYDSVLASIAAGQLAKADNVEIINADALENKNTLCAQAVKAVTAAKEELGGRFMLVANLPYNVAASVMANLVVGGEGNVIADEMHVTVQKEVAERMVSAPGSKLYGILSIYMEACGDAKMIRKLPASVFWPAPQVESAMISFVRNQKKVSRIHNLSIFKDTVNLFMGHRRKMLQGCVKFADGRLEKVHGWHDIFAEAFIDPHKRPEELTATDYISIANLCYEQLQ